MMKIAPNPTPYIIALILLIFLAVVEEKNKILAHYIDAAVETELEACRRLAPKYDAKIEVRLWDATRVDLLNDVYAIEVDWAKNGKWAESIGQALYYAELTDKKPGIILLVRDMNRDRRYVYRCQTVCAKIGIRLWVEKSP